MRLVQALTLSATAPLFRGLQLSTRPPTVRTTGRSRQTTCRSQVSLARRTAAPTFGTPPNPPNLNPDATPTAGGNFGSTVTLCSASVGQSGGTFLYNATYSLTIPESVYAGNYIGSVQYTVA